VKRPVILRTSRDPNNTAWRTDSQTDVLTISPDSVACCSVGRERRRFRSLLLGLRLTGTLALCACLVYFVDWRESWQTLRSASLWIIAVVLGVRFFGVAISAYKWEQLLSLHGLTYRLAQLTRWSMACLFLSYFLPTSIGSDSYRIYKTWSNGKRRLYAFTAVLLDRVSGMIALLLLAIAAAIVTFIRTGNPLAGYFAQLGGIGLIGGAVALLAVIRMRLHGKFRCGGRLSKVVTAFDRFQVAVQNHPRQIIKIFILSFLFHLSRVCAIWLVLEALGAPASYIVLLFVSGASEALGMLPISLGGLGVVDGSFVFLMSQFGVASQVGLSAMLLARTLLVPMSLIGAYFYFSEGRPATDKSPVGDGVTGRVGMHDYECVDPL
jgi:uncharacterized membrane protein YbhN (UPF0104 family)